MITLRNYQDRKVGVFGLGKAGISTANSLAASGAEVFAWDDNPENFAPLRGLAQVKLAEPASWDWNNFKALMLSPGVPLTHPAPHPVVELAKQHNVPVIGDIELFCEALPNKHKIGVTGTNGKSTTSALITHILKTTEVNVELGGNFGIPALSLNPLEHDGCYVLELSSYQLDLVKNAHFNIALLLNITPDHIDRHGTVANYAEAKSAIFNHQTKYDYAIISIDDDYSRSIYTELKQTSKAKITAISCKNLLKQGVFVDKEGMLHDKLDPRAYLTLRINDILNLAGHHNWQNIAFAYTACRLYGLPPKEIEKGLRSFAGLRHRLQVVSTINGIRFINDSKATNAESTAHALAPFSNIYWIVGGKPKAGGIASLEKYFPSINHAFLIGESEEAFAATLDGKLNYTRCGTLEKAFEAASKMALAEHKQNAVVLLSPACASFDQWKNFEERGDAFCDRVEKLLSRIVVKK